MMNGYKSTMRDQPNKDRHEFTRNPNVKLPDTVGTYKYSSKLSSVE
jgi:hypothetical protein